MATVLITFSKAKDHLNTKKNLEQFKNKIVFSDYTFIKSQQSSKLILHKDYTYWYVRRNIKRKTTSWKCSSHNSKKCKATLELDYSNQIVDPDIEHTHPPPKLNPLHYQPISVPTDHLCISYGH